MMLRTAKLLVLRVARLCGVLALLRSSPWRRRRLLILCYHGISIADEHEWAPGLFMSRDAFAARLEALRRGRYNVLPLDEATRRLRDGTLPPRSVVITFDDGTFDFHEAAWPLLRRYRMPATVYLTTYYCEKNLAVFPLAISYLLWKRAGMHAAVDVPRGPAVRVDTRTTRSRKDAADLLMGHARALDLSADEKEVLIERLAGALGVDYREFRRRRLLHLMNPAEVRAVADEGADVQLHTHRHRSPLDEQRYRAEITTNRERIRGMTSRDPVHFCYPSGVCMPQFGPWLRAEGVQTATTCAPGIATSTSDPLQLPRLLDHSELTPIEFEAWLAGLGALLPRRPVGFAPVDTDGNVAVELSEASPDSAGRSAGREVAAPA